MCSVLGGVSSRIPAVVKDVIIKDASCDAIWFCTKAAYQAVSIVDLRSSLQSCVFDDDNNASENWQLVYDVMRVRQNRVMFEKDHIQRICESYAMALSFKQKTNVGMTLSVEKVLLEKIQQYIFYYKPNMKEDINLKFITWLPPRGDRSCSAMEWEEFLRDFVFVLYFVKSFFPPVEWYSNGARLSLLYNAERHKPNAKILQTSLRSRAKALQESTGAFEVLLVRGETDNYLVPEGSRSNYLLLTSDGSLLCSMEKDILVGITLQAVKRATQAIGMAPIKHQSLSLGDICAAEALAILGTSISVLPVREVQVYHDEESKRIFMAALRHYGQTAAVDEAKITSLADSVVLAGGCLHMKSAESAVFKRLLNAYHVEAFS